MNNQTTNQRSVWRLIALVIMALTVAALAACGGEDAPETVATAAVDIPPPATEATEPPAVAPTDAPTAAPTEAPTAAPTAAPTDEPLADALSGGCGNEFFPVVDGRVYHYQTTLEGFDDSSYSQTFSHVTDDSFTLTTSADGQDVVSASWSCADGQLLAPDMGRLMGDMMPGMEINFVEASGWTIPSAEKFTPGESWSAHYVATVEMPDMGAGAMTMQETIDIESKVTGIETVTVVAGTFIDAVRVESTSAVSIAISMGGVTQPSTSFNMTYTTWYAAGTGMVLQEMGMNELIDAASRTELAAMEN